eukprot:500933-Amphidinium_carterae.1
MYPFTQRWTWTCWMRGWLELRTLMCMFAVGYGTERHWASRPHSAMWASSPPSNTPPDAAEYEARTLSEQA